MSLIKVMESPRSWFQLIALGWCYSAFIDPVIISVTVCEIFDV